MFFCVFLHSSITRSFWFKSTSSQPQNLKTFSHIFFETFKDGWHFPHPSTHPPPNILHPNILHLDVGLHLNLGQGQSCLRRLGRRWATTEFGRRGPQQCPQRLHRMDSMGIFAPPKQKCRKEIRVERTLLVGPFGESNTFGDKPCFLSFLNQQIPKASQLFGMTTLLELYKLRPRWTCKTTNSKLQRCTFFQGHVTIKS